MNIKSKHRPTIKLDRHVPYFHDINAPTDYFCTIFLVQGTPVFTLLLLLLILLAIMLTEYFGECWIKRCTSSQFTAMSIIFELCPDMILGIIQFFRYAVSFDFYRLILHYDLYINII